MKIKKYKSMKVFDCQEMPQNIKDAIFEEFSGYNNDICIEYLVYDEGMLEEDFCGQEIKNVACMCKNGSRNKNNWIYYVKGKDIIADWLYQNGAKMGEEVLIKYWW